MVLCGNLGGITFTDWLSKVSSGSTIPFTYLPLLHTPFTSTALTFLPLPLTLITPSYPSYLSLNQKRFEHHLLLLLTTSHHHYHSLHTPFLPFRTLYKMERSRLPSFRLGSPFISSYTFTSLPIHSLPHTLTRSLGPLNQRERPPSLKCDVK